jgi:Ca2+-transporting ATPase
MVDYSGLTASEAEERFSKYGPNRIFTPTKVSFFGIARHEVTEPMILLLLFVGFVYSIWGKLEDALTIFIVISLLVFAEVYNEFRAKKAISSLEKIASPKTKVLRGGQLHEIDSENVVEGDVLLLSSGTKVAADAKVLKTVDVSVDESALTGEPFPKEKNVGEDIFAGTIIRSGEGLAEVTLTGKRTKIGAIASAAVSVKPPKTPLQLSMKKLAGQLVYVAAFFSLLIPVIGVLKGQDLKVMILTGLSLSFATIPEELPIVITMVLGLGSYTLSKSNFLVKRIKAAETLGNASVIVTDKTGTITESKLSIAAVYPFAEKDLILEVARSALSDYAISPLDIEIKNNANPKVLGEVVRQRNLGDGRKTRSVIRKSGESFQLFMSGAPEEIFACCLDVASAVKSALEAETQKGRRVIAVASKSISKDDADKDFPALENGMTFQGLISFEDPPRAGVKEAISQAAKAGIRTIMVTGDHPLTAGYIACRVGISCDAKGVMTGEELDSESDEKLRETVKSRTVFARTTPEHKYRIVKALQGNGEIVAVTGDGINDTLALKGADIGIAMGIKGTDVAKEAAEVIIADDNFNTIARGIFEGRKFFDNLRKGIKYYLSVKAALIMIFLLPVLLNVPMPFSPIQIILLELFMDLAASAGFVREPEEKDIYLRSPRDPREDVIDRPAVLDIFLKGALLFAAVMTVYFVARARGLDVSQTQTYAFAAWIFAHIALAFTSRSDKQTLAASGVFANSLIDIWSVLAIGVLLSAVYVPVISRQFNLVWVPPVHLVVLAAAVSLFIVVVIETKKVLRWA